MSVPKGWGGAASLPDFFGGSAGTGGGALEGELGGLEEADVANDDTFDTPLQASEALPDFFGGGGQKAALEEDDWARQQAEFERLRKLQAARLQGGSGGGGGGPVVLSLSALEGSIEALPVGRSASAGSNGDDDGLMAMDLQQEVDRLTLDEDDEHVITTAVAQAKASREGPRVLSLQEVEAMEAKQQQQAQQALPPPAVSNSGANANAAGLVMRPVPHGLLMSSRDVLYVIQQQLRQMAYSGTNGDAFSDDYYYTQARLREQDKQQDKAQSSGGGSVLAVPVWKETREMARQAQATQVLEARARTTAWEEGHRVLGHTSKSAISRPREILSIARDEPDSSEDHKGDEVLSGGPVLLAGSKPFTSHTWKTRKHVDEVQCVLLCIEECVLSLRNAYVLPDKAAQLTDQLTLHKQSLALLLLPSSPLTPSLLDLPKGLKAFALALPQLPPPSAHGLLPLLTTSLVTRAPPPPSSDWGVAEAPLLSSLLSLLRTEPLPSISLLCASLEGVVKAYMAGPIPLPQQHQATLSLRQALATRNRAEVLHTLLQVGKSQSEGCPSYSDANHWKALHDKLIQMLQQP